MMTFKGLVLGVCVACASFSVFAADQVVKEETMPPAAEGAIKVDEIPPMISINKPAATTTTTTTGTSQQPAAATTPGK